MNLKDKDLLVVQIKSEYNKRYVEIGFDAFFYASEETPLTSKIFSLILLPNNQVLIRLHGSSFLTVDEEGNLTIDLVNEVPKVFEIVSLGNGIYSIISPNGNYLGIRNEDDRLVAIEEEIKENTKFKFRLISYY